jgi:hypothetical protein
VSDVKSEYIPLSDALKRMPVPPPRAGFVDDVLTRATTQSASVAGAPANVFARWETWFGAAIGAAAAVLITLFVLRPDQAMTTPEITLAFNESRTIDVMIDSERTLEDATISISAIGAIEFAGLDDAHQLQFRTRLDQGRNMLSLPVIARASGPAQLVATIEHAGRSRRIAVNVVVMPAPHDKVA